MNDNTAYERKKTRYILLGFSRTEFLGRCEVWVVYRPIAVVEYYVRPVGAEYAPSGLPLGMRLAEGEIVGRARKALGLINSQLYGHIPFELLPEDKRETVEI